MKPIALALLCAASAFAEDLRYAAEGVGGLYTEKQLQASGLKKLNIQGEWVDGRPYAEILQSIRITGAYSKTITNVVSGDNHSGCATCDGMAKYGWALYHPPHEGGGAYVGPTEKWEVTTVENVSVLLFNWLGKSRSIEDREVVSRTTNRWKLESEWRPATNSTEPSKTVTLTNRLSGDYKLKAFGPVITVTTNGLIPP